MTFKNPKKEQRDVYLKPRSLVLMTGEARYYWLHSIS